MYDYGGKALTATITGGFTVNRAGIGPSKVGFFVISDDLSVVRGNHQIAVGGQASAWRSNSYSDHYTIGRATFTGQKTGLGMADFLIGSVSAWTMGTPAVQNKRETRARRIYRRSGGTKLDPYNRRSQGAFGPIDVRSNE